MSVISKSKLNLIDLKKAPLTGPLDVNTVIN